MKVLVATDGSSYSQLALERAADLARVTGAEVKVITVSSVVNFTGFDPIGGQPSMTFEVPCMEDAHRILQDAVAFFAERGIAATTLYRIGQPADSILSAADDEGADLIVMGSHGRTGLTRFLMGSVSSHVVNHAPCSVLVAKTPPVVPSEPAGLSLSATMVPKL